MFWCEHANMKKLVVWLSDFEYFSSSSSIGSVLFFSDFQCNHYIRSLLIWSNNKGVREYLIEMDWTVWLIFGLVGPRYEVIHQFWGHLSRKTPQTGQKMEIESKMLFFLCFFANIKNQMIYLAEKTLAHTLTTITEVEKFTFYI